MVATSFFEGVSRAGRMTPWSAPERHGVDLIKDVPYNRSGSSHHTLDVYRPIDTEGGDLPVLLYIHGGAFRILSKDSHWVFGLAFARRGYVVFNINYRLAPGAPFPAAVEDCAEAYAWVVENAHLYGGDANKLVIAGESAGANLTCALAIAACYERDEPYLRPVSATGVIPKAAMPACGFLDLHDLERFERFGTHRIIIDRMQESHEAYVERGHFAHDEHDLASPLRVFESGERPKHALPPFFVPCGTRDPLIEDSRRLARALSALDVDVDAPEYDGEFHAFHALLWKKNARQCIRDHYGFLDRVLV